MPDNITKIPSALSKFLKPTGEVDRVWYLFLLNLFNLTGGGTNSVTLDDVQIMGAASEPFVDTVSQDNFLSIPPSVFSATLDDSGLLLSAPSSVSQSVPDSLEPPAQTDLTAIRHQLDLLLLTPLPTPAPVSILAKGRATLVAGTATVTTPYASSATEIFLTRRVTGGTRGDLRIGTVTDGVSFVIDSASGADTSTVSWMIVNP